MNIFQHYNITKTNIITLQKLILLLQLYLYPKY